MSTPADPARAEPRDVGQFLRIWLALTIVVILAHFVFFPRMGLYEDDHWLIGVPMCEWNSTSDLVKAWEGSFTSYFQGRPLHLVIGNTCTYFSTHLGGMTGAYALAIGIWAVNTGLCLTLFWRRFGATTATVATLFFVLFPADTTHPTLHVAFCVQPSVTFLLLSGIAYSRGRGLMSVFFAGLTLLTYETCFLPALAWPLLFTSETKPWLRRCLGHGACMAAVLLLAVVVRVKVGEGRASDALKDHNAITAKVTQLALVGPKASGTTFVARPAWVVQSWLNREAFPGRGPSRKVVTGLMALAGLAIVFALALARLRYDVPDDVPDADRPPPDVGSPMFLRLILVGAAMVVLGYVASLTRDPSYVSGRLSSVHIAAALGWGVLMSGVVAALAQLLNRVKLSVALVPALAAYMCLLVGFHVYVQREYVRAWVAQREFWRDVAQECPDVRAGTVILFPQVQQASQMAANQEWADYFVFRHLFVVPREWATPPQAFVVHANWASDPNRVAVTDGKLQWKNPCGHCAALEQGNVILLRQTPTGRFERMTGTIQVAGVDLRLKPREGPSFAFEPNRLYPVMFPNGLKRKSSEGVTP